MFISTDLQLDQHHLKIFPGAVPQGKSAERSRSEAGSNLGEEIPLLPRLLYLVVGLSLSQST
jgi:hypothetical protein